MLEGLIPDMKQLTRLRSIVLLKQYIWVTYLVLCPLQIIMGVAV